MTFITTTQPFLQRLSLRLSYDAGDEVSIYTADGITFLAVQREEAINRAVTMIYEAIYLSYLNKTDNNVQGAIEAMMEAYSVFNHVETYTIGNYIPNSKVLVKPFYLRKAKTIIINSTIPLLINKVALPLTPDQYQRAMTSEYSNYIPSNDRPRFYETVDNIELSIDQTGSLIKVGTLSVSCLKQPVYQVFDTAGDDIIADRNWENTIINNAKIILLSGRQS